MLAASWYRPELLVRSLSTLNVLGDRRLLVGLDLGDGSPLAETMEMTRL